MQKENMPVVPGDLMAEIERLRRENAQLVALQSKPFRLKVSEKGALSVYGINARFPVTLYVEQWERLLAKAEDIRKFISENSKGLTRKVPVILAAFFALTVFSTRAHAKLKFATQVSKAVYLDSAGKQITAGEAVLASVKGERVMKCTEVEASETKNGVSMKTKR